MRLCCQWLGSQVPRPAVVAFETEPMKGDTNGVTLEAQNAAHQPFAPLRKVRWQVLVIARVRSAIRRCAKVGQWAKKDSNLRRQSQPIYSRSSLTA